MLDSVRTRLTLWYVGALALALVAFSIGVYAVTAYNLYQRLDTGLRTLQQVAIVSLTHGAEEGLTAEAAAKREVAELSNSLQSLAIFDADGRLLAESLSRDGFHARLPQLNPIPDEAYIYTASGENDDRYRVAVGRALVAPSGASFIIMVSQPLEPVEEELELLLSIFAYAVPIALLLAGGGGWFLAHKSLAPVVTMSERARRIRAENLEDRLPVANPRDELGKLAETFNDLLARLDAAFAQQRQFMADASHELRTPLHVLRTAAAVTLELPRREEAEYRDALTMINEQAARLTHIVEEMFTLARADAGRRVIEPRELYLDELVAQVARAAGVLATRKGVTIQLAPAAETSFFGDENLLRQMLLNLLDNAIKYTPAGGQVSLQIERKDDMRLIAITDTGGGIPAEAQPHVFERFYRADKARSRSGSSGGNGGGAGLGLSIAQWVAEAHGGTIKLERSDTTGTTFVVALPFTRS
ncbi:MAG: sensor histidine kinase [Blastocatellales bacterium]